MADTISKDKRSEIMSKIKSSNTKSEIKVRHWLYEKGIRYRKNCKDLPGKPDIAIKKYKIAIFINGCFWHGHEGCKDFRIPKTNVEYWQKKISKNIERDKLNFELLKNNGWNVFVIWECQLHNNFNNIMENLYIDINNIINIP